MRGTPQPWGFKIWARTGISGILCDFEVYQGRPLQGNSVSPLMLSSNYLRHYQVINTTKYSLIITSHLYHWWRSLQSDTLSLLALCGHPDNLDATYSVRKNINRRLIEAHSTPTWNEMPTLWRSVGMPPAQ